MVLQRRNRFRGRGVKRHQLSRFISRAPRVESLEARCVLASVGIEAGLLAFNNDGAEDNDVTVSVNGGQLTVHDAGNEITAGAGVTRLDANTVTIEPLEDGVYNIVAQLEDKAGNVSETSEELQIEIDTYEPNTAFLDVREADDSGRRNESEPDRRRTYRRGYVQ
jgi:hypothetical protein